MKQEYYKQCRLRSGNTERNGWIEESAARIGLSVCFKTDPDTWWDVVSVGTARITKETAKAREREYLRLSRKLKH